MPLVDDFICKLRVASVSVAVEKNAVGRCEETYGQFPQALVRYSTRIGDEATPFCARYGNK